MREESTDLNSFLSLLQSSGTLDSTDSFTIDSLKAGRKIASNQLPQDGLWLAKLVQAAVACRARKIDIKFGRREVRFQFEADHWPWVPRKILEELLSGVLPTEPTLFHLYAGLRNSLFEDTVEAEWTISTGERLFKASFDSAGTKMLEETSGRPPGFRLVTSRPPRWPGFKRAAFSPVGQLIKRTADEFMVLHNYCWSCPVPLYIDGRPLEKRYVPGPSLREENFFDRAAAGSHLSSAYKVRPVILVKRALEGKTPLELLWEDDQGTFEEVEAEGESLHLKKHVYFGQTWIDWPLRDKKAGGYLLLLFGAQVTSRIEFLCDGVIVDSHPLPWASKNIKVFGKEVPVNQFKVGVRVLLPVNSSQLDLSHFRVRNLEEIVEKWQPILQDYLDKTCSVALKHSKKFKANLVNQPTNMLGRALSGYLSFLTKVHPILHYLSTKGFRKELESLRESVNDNKV